MVIFTWHLAFLVALGLIIGTPAVALTFDEARHLAARTGFGTPTAIDVVALLELDRRAAAAKLVDGITDRPTLAPPAGIDKVLLPPRRLKDMAIEDKQAFRKKTASTWIGAEGLVV